MTGNIIPREFAVISKPWESDADAANFRAAYLHNLDMLHYAYSAINPVAIKSLMRALGMPSGPLRKPLKPFEGVQLQKGIDIAVRLGLDKVYGYKVNAQSRAA